MKKDVATTGIVVSLIFGMVYLFSLAIPPNRMPFLIGMCVAALFPLVLGTSTQKLFGMTLVLIGLALIPVEIRKGREMEQKLEDIRERLYEDVDGRTPGLDSGDREQ